jgi:lipopolysaccharide transport system permease protein
MELRSVPALRWTATSGLAAEVAEIIKRRDLLVLLVQKDLKVRYKGTALGFFWSLLNPLLMMLVYTAVFSVISRFPIPRYPLFLLSGLLPWNAFAIAITTASMSVIANANLVRRVHFPLEFLPLTSVLSGLVNLLLSLGILLIFALAYRQPLGLPLLALPLLLLLQLIMTTGICLILSSLMVYFRDIEYLITVGMTAFFFGTPVLYSLSTMRHGSTFATFLQFNPMTWLITSYQAIWHENRWPDPHYLLAFSVLSVVVLIVGRLVFRRLEGRFAEEV